MLVYARVLQKWDYVTHRYRQILVPVDWNCKTYTEDFQEVVNCQHCGKELPFGETFTSLEIQTDMGIGYGVCEECHKEELRLKKLYKG